MTARLLFLSTLLLTAAPAAAQTTAFGIGGQLGDPTGVAFRFGAGTSAFDLAAGWDLDADRIFVQGHLLLDERRLGTAPPDLRLFYGPGAFLGAGDDDAALGFSFNAGLNIWTGPLEIFAQLTPRLQLVEETDFDLGGALGIRYYPSRS